jgi:hypothetical protein
MVMVTRTGSSPSAGRTRTAGLPGLSPAGPPHPQGTQEKGAEERGNADDQQVQQAIRGDAHDAQRGRHDYQQQEEAII